MTADEIIDILWRTTRHLKPVHLVGGQEVFYVGHLHLVRLSSSWRIRPSMFADVPQWEMVLVDAYTIDRTTTKAVIYSQKGDPTDDLMWLKLRCR